MILHCNRKYAKSLEIKIINPSHAAIKISINATAAGFICKNIFPTPVQVKIIINEKKDNKQCLSNTPPPPAGQ